MKFTKVFWKTFRAFKSGVRFIISKGGSRSGKTYSNLQLLHLTIESDKTPTVNSVVAMTMPHLRKGAIRDFINILRSSGSFVAARWNSSVFTYTYPNGSIIEFFSADSEKVHGAQRDRLFLNECQFIHYEAARQLFVRTSGQIILDFNPTKRFWVDEKIIDNKENEGRWELIHSTYVDNNFLAEEQVKEIESNKYDAAWWQVYGEGITGSVKSGYEFYSHFSGNNIKARPFDKERAMHISFDFNVSPYITATIIQMEHVENIWNCYVVKEFALKNPYNKTEDLAQAIKNYIEGTTAQVFIYGDASGSNESTRARQNEYDIIESVLRPYLNDKSWRTVRSNPRLKARRQFMNKVLAGGWHIRLFVDPTCSHVIEDFENVLENPEGGKLKQRIKDSETGMTYEPFGHTSDSIDYTMCEAFRDDFSKI